MTFEMPKREACDGPIGLSRPDEHTIAIEACHEGKRLPIVVSRYNAARILVMLCLMLEVKPPKEIAKMPM